MSTAGGGKKGGPKGSKKVVASENSDRATPASVKGDATSSSADPDVNADMDMDKKEGKAEEGGGVAGTTPKPPVSAAQMQRDAAQKVLNLALKQEWTPMEQTLKGMEKMVAAGGEDINSTPLMGIMDPVSGEMTFRLIRNRRKFRIVQTL